MQQADRRLTPPFCCFVVVFEDGEDDVVIWTVFTLKQIYRKLHTLFFYTEPCANIFGQILLNCVNKENVD